MITEPDVLVDMSAVWHSIRPTFADLFLIKETLTKWPSPLLYFFALQSAPNGFHGQSLTTRKMMARPKLAHQVIAIVDGGKMLS